MGKLELDIIREKVMDIIVPVINALDLELDDIELSKMRGKALLRVFIDREGGVTIDDCERASREVEAILDVEDPIPCSYVLEVSSPGLDRPLKGPKDFTRFTGRSARVVTIQPVEKESFFIGKIAATGDSGIELLLPQDRRVTIEYKNISKARLEVEV
ncbi:MAG: ribosome maturation factor RimP [Nitrospirota bacterium]